MAEMTKRERVERTFRFEETDRVPMYDLLRCDAAFVRLSGETLPPLAKTPEVAETVNRIAGAATDRLLDMTRAVGFGPLAEEDIVDGEGFTIHSSPREKTSWVAARPFGDERGAAAYVGTWIGRLERDRRQVEREPGPFRERWHADFLQTQALIGGTVNLLAQQAPGLDAIRNRIGFELFAYLEADRPDLVSEFLEVHTAYEIAACHAVADRRLSPAVLTYGDIACKERLLHSPAFLRRDFFPRLRRLNDAWHEHGMVCLFHSDGYLMDVMEDLIAAGIDGLNPVETVAGMDLGEVRRRCGRKVFLTGGIDMSQLLSLGEPDEVRTVCRRAIRDAYPGYFLGSTTELDNSARLDNVLAMLEVSREPLEAILR